MNSTALRSLLASRQIRPADLAREAHVSLATISAFAGGYLPIGKNRCRRLKEALTTLGCSPSEIETVFGYEDSTPKSSA